MDERQIIDKLTEIFADVFDDSSLKLDRTTAAEQVEAWDSLSHVNLVAAVEAIQEKGS